MKGCDVSHDVRFFSAETLEFNGVVLDNAKSLIIFKSNDAAIKLTELQRRFMYCLMTGIVSKDEIIRNVWPGNHQVVSDNSYYQMIFQCRTLLSRHGIPADTIKTIPRFGVMLSQDTRDYHLNNDKKKEILQSGWRSRWKTWLEAVNFKLALALTLIFLRHYLLASLNHNVASKYCRKASKKTPGSRYHVPFFSDEYAVYSSSNVEHLHDGSKPQTYSQ